MDIPLLARFSLALPRTTAGTRLVRVLVGTAVLAAASRAWLPFVGTAVPFTLQPQAVLLVAATLGSREALAATLLWFSWAACGVPVFAGFPGTAAAFAGPTAGYLASYVGVALWVGRFGRGHDIQAAGHWAMATFFVLACGSAWLAPWLGLRQALVVGLWPFLLADAGKAAAVFAARRLLAPRSGASQG